MSVIYSVVSRLGLDPASMHNISNECVESGSMIFKVSEDNKFPRRWPEVAVSDDGTQLVVSYAVLEAYLDTPYKIGFVFRRFDLRGNPLSDETFVDYGEDPSVDFDNDGNFSIAWHRPEEGHSSGFSRNWSIYRQLFSPDGFPLSPIVSVPTNEEFSQWRPTNLSLGDGVWLITYYAETGSIDTYTLGGGLGAPAQIRGKVFRGADAISEDMLISTPDSKHRRQWRQGVSSKSGHAVTWWYAEPPPLTRESLKLLVTPISRSFISGIMEVSSWLWQWREPVFARVISREGDFMSEVISFPGTTDFGISDTGYWLESNYGLARWRMLDGTQLGWPFPVRPGEIAMRGNGDFVVLGEDGCIWPYDKYGNLIASPISIGGFDHLAHVDMNDLGDVVITWEQLNINEEPADVWVSIVQVPYYSSNTETIEMGPQIMSLNKTIPYTLAISLLILSISPFLMQFGYLKGNSAVRFSGMLTCALGAYGLWLYSGPLIGGVVGRLARYHETAALFSILSLWFVFRLIFGRK